ncbi:FMN reductase [Virgisporangium aliadipatigenens]|uniref:FMN reductase n=1 Tax=Virgisporangium aliadipatigenens TaxID=741659 RepID=A0A8J4DUR8_9ACTN|nr:NAD(P)H-dependent oxidoreductase [Virgisporangium aliadipatigenens]GIJ50681.1 FMN reductase [Virgisporangium aliadipatigenens]
MNDLRIGVIVGSTRPGRRAETVARWIIDEAARHPGGTFDLVDLADHDLPLLDEPIPAMAGNYHHPHTRRWAETIAGYDGFVFVVPEYNRSIPAALKNAVDYLFAEWRDKAAGFVGYGATAGGSRAVEHLRQILAEVHVADVRTPVLLGVFDDFDADGRPAPRPHHAKAVDMMLGELLTWGRALRTVRA